MEVFDSFGIQIFCSRHDTRASLGVFASAVDSQNGQSCFAPNLLNATHTSTWTKKHTNTNIPGTTQAVLVLSINLFCLSMWTLCWLMDQVNFTWILYVSALGQYNINLLVFGCSDFEDCLLRTPVKVTMFPGGGQNPSVTIVSQQNMEDSTTLMYSGPVILL